MQQELYESFDRLLSDLDVPARIRHLNDGQTQDSLWQELQQSGFLDVMVPERLDGAGLGWRDAWAVMFVAGRHGLPQPVAQTIFARALLAHHAVPYPDSPITIALAAGLDPQGDLDSGPLPALGLASHALAQVDDHVLLLPLAQARLQQTSGWGGFDGRAIWPAQVVQAAKGVQAEDESLVHGLALGLAVALAGACDRVLAMTLQYANDRSQFGKPIGKFQAVQQQLAEMAELVYSARMASQIGCQSDGWQVAPHPAQVAKVQTSAVAGQVAAIAHAVHAAIGVTQEYDLQLYTRRLYEWARSGAGADYWSAKIGQAALKSDNLLDFMRQKVF